MPITPEQLAQLREVNARENAIPYSAVPGVNEPPDWTSPTPRLGWSWVCRDYVQRKADALEMFGWDPNRLWSVICWTEPVAPVVAGHPYSGRERHEVLEVRLSGETWILDSRWPEPERYGDPAADIAAYLWEGEQLPDNSFLDVSRSGLTVLPA